MPTARESLLDAAREAVERHPWPMVRMVEVAAAAGVSRQTLYNEFGDKAGLGSALVERQIGRFLDGFASRLAAGTTGLEETLARGTDWITAAARRDRLVRATLTGCHGTDLPPSPVRPTDLVTALTERALAELARRDPPEEGLAQRCETAVRLALSYVVAPPAAAAPAPRPGPGSGRRAVPGARQSPSWRSRVASRRRSE